MLTPEEGAATAIKMYCLDQNGLRAAFLEVMAANLGRRRRLQVGNATSLKTFDSGFFWPVVALLPDPELVCLYRWATSRSV